MARPRRERPRRRWIRTLEGCETTVGCAGRRDETGERRGTALCELCESTLRVCARCVILPSYTKHATHVSVVRPLLCACARTRLPRRRKVYNVAIRNRIIRAEEEMLAKKLSLIDELVLPTASLPSTVP